MLVLKPEYPNLNVLNVPTQNSLARNKLLRKKALFSRKLHTKVVQFEMFMLLNKNCAQNENAGNKLAYL